MDFFTARDLRTQPKSVWEGLKSGGKVVITNNGHPTALMLDIADGNFEEVIQAVRQDTAMIALNNMRKKASDGGFMSEEEIESEIVAARGEREKR